MSFQFIATKIKNIANSKVNGNESTEKQLQNILLSLDWQTTVLTDKHPALALSASQNLRRKAKLILNVAQRSVVQSSIDVTNDYPRQHIVVISDEILLRDQIAKLNHENLSTIPSAIAQQWSRNSQAPPITKKLIYQLQSQLAQCDRQTSDQTENLSLINLNAKSPITLNAKSSDKSEDLAKPHQALNQKFSPNYRQIFIRLMKFGIISIFLVTILLFGWRLVQPPTISANMEKNWFAVLSKCIN